MRTPCAHQQCPKHNEVLARFERLNLVRFGPDKMGLIFPRSDLSISDLKSLASEPVYSSTVVECSGTMFRRHVPVFLIAEVGSGTKFRNQRSKLRLVPEQMIFKTTIFCHVPDPFQYSSI